MGKVIIKLINDKLHSVDGLASDVEIHDEDQIHYMTFRSQEEIYEKGTADKYFRDSTHQDIMEKR